MENGSRVLAILGMSSISIMLILMGMLSHRLGRVTRSGPYYLGFYTAAGFIAISVFARIIHLFDQTGQKGELRDYTLWVLLYNGAPAVGVTLGLLIAWRYWSWLLAERG